MPIRHVIHEEAGPLSAQEPRNLHLYMLKRHPFPTWASLELSPTSPWGPT